jgi:uncharacterized hydrophobic protein (TIGR00271 family)
MVLGPEFVPLSGIALGMVHGRRGLIRRSTVSLLVGFAVAIAVATLAALAGRALGWYGTELLTADRPQTGFITAPDRWSVVVAVLAGIAGVLSLTSAKSGALVGVFISVTTVPAAGAMALFLALGGGRQFAEAAAQLGINLAGILVAAVVTLVVQRMVWRRVPRAVPRTVGPRGSAEPA